MISSVLAAIFVEWRTFEQLAGANRVARFAFAIVLAGLPIRDAWLRTAARA